MKHTILFVFAVVIAVLFTTAFTSDTDAQKILDGKYFKSSYRVNYIDSPDVTPDGAQTGLVIRSESGWNGGYVKIRMMFSGTVGQRLNALVYSGVKFGNTNSAGTNYWVSTVTSNLGGKFVGTNGTTTYTMTTSTNTNTNGNNLDVQCLYNARSNTVLYTTIGGTNNANGTAKATAYPVTATSPCSIVHMGTLVSTYNYVNATTPIWGETPTFFLPASTYMVVVFTNVCTAYNITNLFIDLEFTRK